jgi:hypothetical protein
MKGLLITVIVILGAFALTMRGTWTGDLFHTWLTNELQTPLPSIRPPNGASVPIVSLVETHPLAGCDDSGYGCIAGTVKNNTANTYTYAEVVISLYDKSGAQIGDDSANTLNLEPYATWKFEVPITHANVATYRVSRLTVR